MKHLFLFLCICIASIRLTAQAQDSLETEASNKWAYFSVRPGVSVDHLTLKGEELENISYSDPRSFSVSGAVDFDCPELKNFIIRLELTYARQHYHGKEYAGTIMDNDLIIRTITPEIELLYKIPLTSKLRMYGGMGVGQMNMKVLRDHVTIYYIDPFEHDSGLITWAETECFVGLTAGFIYNNRIELAAKWSRSNRDFSAYYNVTGELRTLALTYRF